MKSPTSFTIVRTYSNIKTACCAAFVFISILFVVPTAHAATLVFSPVTTTVSINDTVHVRIALTSTDQSANAVSGTVSFPTNLLTLTSVVKSGSVIDLWPKDPSYSNTNGTAHFEGVVLDGYRGSSGTIVTLIFKAKATGTPIISFINASVLAHNGQGTEIIQDTGKLRIDILPSTAPTDIPKNTTESTTPVSKPISIDIVGIQIQELKKQDETDPRSRFLITSTFKKPNTAYTIQIDNVPYIWNDSVTNIFETVPLAKGLHTIKASLQTVDGIVVSNDVFFAHTGIVAPIIVEYSQNVPVNEYIVVKGLTSPLIYVTIVSDYTAKKGGDIVRSSTTVHSDEKGLFTYVSDARTVKGSYMVSAYVRMENDIEGDHSIPIKIVVGSDYGIRFNTQNMPIACLIIGILAFITALGIHRRCVRKEIVDTGVQS